MFFAGLLKIIAPRLGCRVLARFFGARGQSFALSLCGGGGGGENSLLAKKFSGGLPGGWMVMLGID